MRKKTDDILREIFNNEVKYLNEESNKFKEFWGKSLNHFNITVLLSSVSADETGYSYEDICSLYSHKLASRTTLHTILTDGVQSNFFVKNVDDKDHRKHMYKLNNYCKIIILNWLESHPAKNLNK